MSGPDHSGNSRRTPGGMRFASRGALWRMGAVVLAAGLAASCMTRMPGRSHRGPLPPLTGDGQKLRERLRHNVCILAGQIGERHLDAYSNLTAAASWIEAELRDAGYPVERQEFTVRGRSCVNLIATRRGTRQPDEIIVIGAHYDTVPGTPGANDNGSGVAAVLALARAFREREPGQTVRFVAFANEEPPYFQTDSMGSFVYARHCRERQEHITAMLSLETIGCYSDATGSQHYPGALKHLYPATGNFVGFVGNLRSRGLVRGLVGRFRALAAFPSEGAALPAWIPGVDWSDHWSFWKHGYPAVMVTDTAPYRYAHYHSPLDTPDQIDFDRLARVVEGLESVIAERAGPAK